jgi:hypothetical protein
MKIYLNDLADDHDGDGVSSAIENRIGTCDGIERQIGVFRCVTTAFYTRQLGMTPSAEPRALGVWMDPRDTDGDGLSDRAEIFGADNSFSRPEFANGRCGDGTLSPQNIPNADQTFPLWGFSPRKRDMLVEIDLARERQILPGGTTDQSCNYAGPCAMGESPLRPMLQERVEGDLDVWSYGFVRPMSYYVNQLRIFHQHFANLTSVRVANPDLSNGIEVHFDITSSTVVTTGHGLRPLFNITSPIDGMALPGLIIYQPVGRSGSTCQCGAANLCPSSRHAGYAHYARATPQFGGGQSGPNGVIDMPMGSGSDAAHEAGHHLGLSHGGPNRSWADAGSSAIAFYESERNDLLITGKVAHYSIMNYSYATRAPFSRGMRNAFPLPRTVDGEFGFPETYVFGLVDSSVVASYANPAYAVSPAGCDTLSSPWCINADFNRDGTYSGNFLGAVAATDPAQWFQGEHVMVQVPGMWCASELRSSGLRNEALCCNAGRLSGGRCLDSSTTPPTEIGPTTNIPETNTMLLAASPAATVANQRLYTFFFDDSVSGGDTRAGNISNTEGAKLPRRCSFENNAAGECTPTTATVGRLRWAAVDTFAEPTPAVGTVPDPHICLSRTTDCTRVAPGAREYGVVSQVDPLLGPTTINTLGVAKIAATTLRSASGDETVMLAWTTRLGFECAPYTNGCRDTWQPLQVRFASATTMETGSFVPIPSGLRGPVFPGGAGTRISSVAVVAWDPGPTATRSTQRALLFAREARGQADGGTLWWTVCSPSTGCDEMQRLRIGASTDDVISDTAIAAAVDHPLDGSGTSVGLVYGRRPIGGPLGASPRFQLVRILPDGTGGITTSQTEILYRNAVPVGTVPESGVSIAFADGSVEQKGRLFLVHEWTDGADLVPTFHESQSWPFSSESGADRMSPAAITLWSLTRPRSGFRTTTGAWNIRPSDGPGHIPTLFFDERVSDPGTLGFQLTTARTRYLERNVRMVRNSVEQNGPRLSFIPVADPRPLASHFDYDEHSQLAFQLCPTIAGSSRGMLGPDLDSTGPLGPLRCPGAASFVQQSAMGLHLSNRVMSQCRGSCLRFSTPTEIFDAIADAIVDQGMYATRPPDSFPKHILDDPPIGRSRSCSVGMEQGPYHSTLEQPQ